jgi:hypothetical protein
MGALTLILALAAPAFGQAPGPVGQPLPAPPLPTVENAVALMRTIGKPTVDISLSGAVPGVAGRTATRKALQSALDALATAGGLPPGRKTVYIPAGDWWLDYRVSAPAGTRDVLITGDGPASSLTPYGNGWCPLVLGLPLRPAPHGRAMDPAQFFPLDDLLDGTVKGRYGYRTCPVGQGINGFATAWDSPLDLGPPRGWGSVGCLTIEFAIDTTATPIGRAHVAGMSRGPVAGPWLVLGAPGQVRCLATLDGEPASRTLAMAYREAGGVRRFAFQRNLATGVDLLALDGTRVAPIGAPVPAGSKLADNLDLPFHLGASGASGVTRSDFFQGNPTTDLAVCGLRVSTVPRYRDDTPIGQPIARIDGAPVSDLNSYVLPEPGTLGALSIAGDPADLAATRTVPFSSARVPGFAAFAMDPDHGSNQSTIGPIVLSNLALHSTGAGSALTLGAAIDTAITGVTLDGGYRGLGSPSGLVNYTLRMRDSSALGSVGGVRLHGATAILDAIGFGRVGRDGALSSRASVVTVRDSWVQGAFAAGCVPRTYFRSAGGALMASNISIDNEESASPTLATFAASATYGDVTNQPAFLRVERSGSNTHKGMTLIRLDRESANAPLATARIIDPEMSSADAVVATLGGWSVILDDPGDRKGMAAVLDLSPAGPPAPGQSVGTVSVAGAK